MIKIVPQSHISLPYFDLDTRFTSYHLDPDSNIFALGGYTDGQKAGFVVRTESGVDLTDTTTCASNEL
jgi:hypothetical protein